MKTLSNNRNFFATIFFTLAVVFTSINSSAQSANYNVLASDDEALEIENWMTDLDNFANTPTENSQITLAVFFNDEDFEEEELAISEWMLDTESYFENTHDQFNFALLEEEENETLAVEAWMTSIETFYDAPTHKLPSIDNINLNEPCPILIALHDSNF